MTELLITPNFGNKTAKFKGTVAAGEKVRVRIVGALQYLSDNLRLRFCNCKDTLAIFLPETYDGEWTANGDDLECTINLNTVQMLQFVKHSSGCAVSVIFDNPKEDVLYFSDFHYVEAWSREVGDDEPFDLSQFPRQIKSWEKRLDNLRVEVEEVAGGIELTICDGVSPAKTVTIFHGKEGRQGEQGVPGKQGEQGVPGEQGIPGKDLSKEVGALSDSVDKISLDILTNSEEIESNRININKEEARAQDAEKKLSDGIDEAKANAAGAMGAASKAKDAADSAVNQINTLAGDDAGKSVRTIAGEEARTAVNRVVNGAPETFDTLKEIAGYIKEDQSGAAQMAASIAQNAEAIAAEAARAKAVEQEIARDVAKNELQISNVVSQVETKAEKSALEAVDARVKDLEANAGSDVITADKFETTGGTVIDDDGIFNGEDNRGVVFNNNGSVTISNGGMSAIVPANTDGNLATEEYVEEKLSEIKGGVAELMTPITHAELLTLRDSSQLVPGMQYRITDYVATTKQDNTKSANHPFDIIVTADDEGTLNEVARAIRREGDTYFANCKLEAWKIWYCLDNDESRFEWATSSEEIDGIAVAGKGVIYRMIDEWDNDVPYDFKGILTKAYIDGSWSSDYRYTFGGSRDETVNAESTCHSNKMGAYITSSKQKINQNSFDSGCYGNSFDSDCSNNSFDSGCYGNSFGLYCTNNSFGSGCYDNTFGADEDTPLDYYQYITFGNGCKGLNLYCTASTSWEQVYKNVEIKSGVTGEVDEYGDLIASKTITDDNVNQSFHTTYKPVGSMEVSV